MKRLIPVLLCVLLICSLIIGCTSTKDVTFYCTERILTTYMNDVTNENRSVFTYDASWNMTSNLSYMNGTEVNALYYEYNNDATLVKVTQQFNGTETVGEYRRTYDKEGNLLKELAVENGTVVSTNEYTYDNNGNVLVHTLTPTPATVITNTYTYDKAGNRISYENNTAYPEQDMEFVVLTEYEYDENGNLLREIVSTEDTETAPEKSFDISLGKVSIADNETVTEYTYDDATKTYLGTRYTSEGTVQNYIRMVYDDHGNLLLQEVMNPEKTIVSSTIQSWVGTDGSVSKYEQ